MNKEVRYNVVWGLEARMRLAKLKRFNINPRRVFRNSKNILSTYPQKKANDIINLPDFEFNGYYWTYINNVIIVYEVLESEKMVLIDAFYSALTGFALQAFFGEHDTDPL